MQDHELAGLLAQEAGNLLLGIRDQAVAEGWPSYHLQDEGDRQAHRHLVDRLAELRPDDGLLSEEGTDDGARLEASRVWILDPLGGTRDFGRPARIEWAVHVALAEGGRPSGAAAGPPRRGREI